MKRKGYKIILVWILVLADLAAAAVLAVGVNMGMKSGDRKSTRLNSSHP